MLRHPFLRAAPPKTTGREEFGEPFVQRSLALARRLRLPDADIVATATAFTAATIAGRLRAFCFTQNFLPPIGGNCKSSSAAAARRTPTLRRMLAERIAPARALLTQDDLGNSSAGKEALAFAILAHETLCGQPANVPSATGARHPVIFGKDRASREERGRFQICANAFGCARFRHPSSHAAPRQASPGKYRPASSATAPRAPRQNPRCPAASFR